MTEATNGPIYIAQHMKRVATQQRFVALFLVALLSACPKETTTPTTSSYAGAELASFEQLGDQTYILAGQSNLALGQVLRRTQSEEGEPRWQRVDFDEGLRTVTSTCIQNVASPAAPMDPLRYAEYGGGLLRNQCVAEAIRNAEENTVLLQGNGPERAARLRSLILARPDSASCFGTNQDADPNLADPLILSDLLEEENWQSLTSIVSYRFDPYTSWSVSSANREFGVQASAEQINLGAQLDSNFSEVSLRLFRVTARMDLEQSVGTCVRDGLRQHAAQTGASPEDFSYADSLVFGIALEVKFKARKVEAQVGGGAEGVSAGIQIDTSSLSASLSGQGTLTSQAESSIVEALRGHLTGAGTGSQGNLDEVLDASISRNALLLVTARGSGTEQPSQRSSSTETLRSEAPSEP